MRIPGRPASAAPPNMSRNTVPLVSGFRPKNRALSRSSVNTLARELHAEVSPDSKPSPKMSDGTGVGVGGMVAVAVGVLVNTGGTVGVWVGVLVAVGVGVASAQSESASS